MLRARVSLGRKVSRGSDSTSYTVTLDGEVPHPPDDAEAVLEKVSELFHLAEEALSAEIERDRDDQATGRRDEAPPSSPPNTGHHPRHESASSPQPATPKQLQFLQSLGQRKGMNRDAVDAVISLVVGASKRADDLSKREAGRVIDHLTKLEPEAAR